MSWEWRDGMLVDDDELEEMLERMEGDMARVPWNTYDWVISAILGVLGVAAVLVAYFTFWG